MSAGELALVVAVVLCALAFAALVAVLTRLLQTMRTLEAALDTFVGETRPLVDELRRSVEEARDDLDRFDAILGSAEAISTRVEGASRVARAALSRPVIKTVALASGTQRAARRLRRNDSQGR